VDALGKMLVAVGLAMAVLGLFLWLGPVRGRGGFLPGDLFIDKANVKFYFPVVTCLLLSVLLTVLFWLFRK
jgi:hypothetical protein